MLGDQDNKDGVYGEDSKDVVYDDDVIEIFDEESNNQVVRYLLQSWTLIM